MPKKLFLSGWSLRKLLLLLLSLSLAMTLLLLSITAAHYGSTIRSYEENARSLYENEQEKLLMDTLANIRISLFSLVNKRETIDYLNGSTGYKITANTYMTALIEDVTQYVPGVLDVAMIMTGNRVVASTNHCADIYSFLARNKTIDSHMSNNAHAIAYYTIPSEDASQYALAIAVPVQSTAEQASVIAFCNISGLLGKQRLMNHTCLVLHDDTLVYASRDDLLTLAGRQTFQKERNTVHLSLKAAGWDIWSEYPLNSYERDTDNLVYRWILIAALVFAVIECMMVIAIHHTIVAPIINISSQTERISSSNASIDNPAHGRNELNTLVRNLNEMIARTTLLTCEINDVKLSMMRLDIARLKERNMFLQAQINPHFLYNMLECICGMASQHNNPDIREMTRLLSRMYQYCLRSPDSTIGEELYCVDLYCRMIRLRYNEQYDIRSDIPEELYPLPIPRMVLEPILENAVQHGFVRGEALKFHVNITARMDNDTLDLLISDDGCGMDPVMIDQVNRKLSSQNIDPQDGGERIGLYNVGLRLRLRNDMQSGLVLAQNTSGGLDVHLRIHYFNQETKV